MRSCIWVVVTLLVFLPSLLLGEQRFSVSTGDVVRIKLSSRELTRVAVENGRIDKLWGASGILESQVDKKEGEIFLRPSASASKAFSFFIRDSFGSTYTVIAEQFDIPSQTVILAPTNKISKADKEKYKNRDLVSKIKELIKVMANRDSANDKIQSHNQNEVVGLWAESRVILVKTHRLETLKGETFSFKNISKKDMQIVENEFLNFRPNILAVAIEKLNLRPGEETKLYVVRRGE